ncbi:MAG: nicotinate phosphoribosyltransferase [Oscillospiraceae bacterium]|nr:nicotinate phosphoribosyltransferase [Oscillospiraceae bacterium]
MNNVNYTMLFDYYELTMGNGYFEKGLMDRVCYFDLFYRRVPGDGGYVITAGLEQAIDYIKNLHFDEKDIEYLRSKKQFSEDFLEYLKDFKFTGDVWAVPEGTVVFPNEPIMTIRAPAIQAQLLETFLLLTINHQSLIATKANRIVRAAEGRVIAEFGSRRAHGPDAAVLGARAAYIGGAAATACALTDEEFGVPATGTMAHSWVQMFDTEYEAFKAYCEVYPDNATLLVDTYNVLKSGVPNAIKAFDEVLKPLGKRPKGIRIDSGDITYLSQKARKMLDDAGYPDCKITASNSLDEYLIRDMLLQGAKVDSFGVGERLITSKPSSVLDGVYKLVAFEDENGNVIPKIKISENVQKITTPHFKKLYRLYDNDNGKAIADYLCVHDETVNDMEPLEIFDPDYTWKRRTLENYTARELLVPIFKNGECVYNMPTLSESRNHCIREIATMWDSVLRFENPHVHYVDLSQKLWDIKQNLLNEHSHHFTK